MNNEAIEKTADDADDEPITSKGGEGGEARAAGSGTTTNIKVGSPTDGSGIVADPDQ